MSVRSTVMNAASSDPAAIYAFDKMVAGPD